MDTPLVQVTGLPTELAQQHALSLLVSLPPAEALETGLEIADACIVAIGPEAQVARDAGSTRHSPGQCAHLLADAAEGGAKFRSARWSRP